MGGLGAALSQYSTALNQEGAMVHDQPTSLMKRRSSGGNLLVTPQNRSISFHSERRRAASPLFNSRAQDRRGSPKLFSSMLTSPPLLDPPDISRLDIARPLTIHRPLPSKVSVRDGSGSSLSITPTNFYPLGNSINRGMVRTIKFCGGHCFL